MYTKQINFWKGEFGKEYTDRSTYKIWVGGIANHASTFITKSKEVAFFNINNKVENANSPFANTISIYSIPIFIAL